MKNLNKSHKINHLLGIHFYLDSSYKYFTIPTCSLASWKRTELTYWGKRDMHYAIPIFTLKGEGKNVASTCLLFKNHNTRGLLDVLCQLIRFSCHKKFFPREASLGNLYLSKCFMKSTNQVFDH